MWELMRIDQDKRYGQIEYVVKMRSAVFLFFVISNNNAYFYTNSNSNTYLHNENLSK